MADLVQVRRGTAAAAAANNPVLAEGEPGYELDTGVLKIGDGSTAWNDLPAITEGVVGTYVPRDMFPVALGFAITNETSVLSVGTQKITVRSPFAFTLTEVRASLLTASSSGLPTFDINLGGVSVLSTKITIDVGERTSMTATTLPVISTSAIPDDGELSFDIDVAGSGAAGAKIWLLGVRDMTS